MKFVKIFLTVVMLLIAIFFIGGMFLPKTYSVSRSISIAATDTIVYKNIANFNSFLEWNAWSKMDSTTTYRVTGIPEKISHQYHWKGKQMGEGEMKIIEVRPFEQIKMDLKFIKPFESLAKVRFNLNQEAKTTNVTWNMSGENNMISKWMCLVMGGMDKMVGKDLEDGLETLKEKSERK